MVSGIGDVRGRLYAGRSAHAVPGRSRTSAPPLERTIQVGDLVLTGDVVLELQIEQVARQGSIANGNVAAVDGQTRACTVTDGDRYHGNGRRRLASLASTYLETPMPGLLPAVGAAAVLTGAAVIASLIPAARASRVDVLQVLRSE